MLNSKDIYTENFIILNYKNHILMWLFKNSNKDVYKIKVKVPYPFHPSHDQTKYHSPEENIKSMIHNFISFAMLIFFCSLGVKWDCTIIYALFYDLLFLPLIISNVRIILPWSISSFLSRKLDRCQHIVPTHSVVYIILSIRCFGSLEEKLYKFSSFKILIIKEVMCLSGNKK